MKKHKKAAPGAGTPYGAVVNTPLKEYHRSGNMSNREEEA